MNYGHTIQQLENCGLDYSLSTEEHARLSMYFDLRRTWSETHNVAGPRSMGSPWELDFPDAVAALLVLDAELPLVDVGTGSGTPGLLIACMDPDRVIYLVEPLAKRTAFLRVACAELGLRQVTTIRGRWPQPLKEPAVQVISRAVVSPDVWPSLANRRAPQNDHIVRMLAAHRPKMDGNEYRLRTQVAYDLKEHGQRVIERWSPTGPDAA
jgi:16S rRNA G527 N7-methylase RsmG